MKALILVGGFGTRLRPLTLKHPKPLVEFANKPMILHQIEALKAIGVTEVVLAINYKPEEMMNFLKDFDTKLDIKITCSQETEPLGTAGPLALARDKLIDDSGEPFFVLNSDVICEYPLKLMIEFHKAHGGEASIMVTKVDEPSKYGVVVMEESTGKVERFVEKPKAFVGNQINAGIYLLNPSVVDRIELRPTSIEKEVFPKIAAEKKLYAMALPGFWMDIGQPRDYITGLRLYLDSLRKKSPSKLATGPHIVGNVLVDETAEIGEGCLIGPDVAIGPGCVVESGVRLSRCSVMSGVTIKEHACISSSIIGWSSTVGQGACVEKTVLGEAVHVKKTSLGEVVYVCDDVYSNVGVVLPDREIESSNLKPESNKTPSQKETNLDGQKGGRRSEKGSYPRTCGDKDTTEITYQVNFEIQEHLAKAKPLILRTENPVVSLSLLTDNDRLDRSSQIKFHRPYAFEIVASCNGVVCLRGRYPEFDGSRRLILWNPSIKKTLRLPPPRSFTSTVPTLLGLGYDPRSDDYKVPRIVRLGNSAEHPFVFQFFSLNSGSWNENVDFFSSSLENKDALRSITLYRYDNQAIVNGVIHWLLNRRDEIDTEMSSNRWSPLMHYNDVFVLAFHLSNDSFGEIRLPECFDDTTKVVTCRTISVFKDLLSFNVFDGGPYSRRYNCEIWVMEQYGVRESWTRLYQIEMLHVARPVVLRSNGEILMAGYGSDRLVSCQPLAPRIRDTGLELSIDGYAAYFVESLALLDK
ncbi:hypothetical protein NC651_019279 [Populus alba x Populus x berolinensis]|nr:hypothetical protein NC651_019279 [Populus alba x Populus x berolinensis]